MHKAVVACVVLSTALLAGCLGGDDLDRAENMTADADWLQDAVVVAVVDFGFNPYHMEWDAQNHPANQDNDSATDFMFDAPPHEYLSGFPEPSSFASYEGFKTTRATAQENESYDLMLEDQDAWDGFNGSSLNEVSYYWLPDTKVVGLVSFSQAQDPAPVSNSTAHGARVASVSAGSFYGSCPECLLVFVQHGPGALEWVNSQDWIDVVTNSYGSSGALARTPAAALYPGTAGVRSHVYAGDDTRLTREASERGQTTVFSSGNGARNSFNVPTSPLTSSQRGPDWILRVGAIYHDTHNAPMGVGKPVDVASLGTGYPSQGHPTVSSEGAFSGTSNAAPVTAGMLARSLFQARLAMEGPSRIQEDGVVSVGEFACGEAQTDCALGSGALHRSELVDRFLQSAAPVTKEWQPRATRVCTPDPAPEQCAWPGVPAATDEMRMLVEGHGVFWGRFLGDEKWNEQTELVVDQLKGNAALMDRPTGEREWFQTVSYCNQKFWGEWDEGWWKPGEALPGPDPGWPVRTSFVAGCDEAATAFHAYLDLADAG